MRDRSIVATVRRGEKPDEQQLEDLRQKVQRSTAGRQLAERVAAALFVNGSGERAERLVLTIDGPPKRDLGGLSQLGATNSIERVLAGEARSDASPPLSVHLDPEQDVVKQVHLALDLPQVKALEADLASDDMDVWGYSSESVIIGTRHPEVHDESTTIQLSGLPYLWKVQAVIEGDTLTIFAWSPQAQPWRLVWEKEEGAR